MNRTMVAATAVTLLMLASSARAQSASAGQVDIALQGYYFGATSQPLFDSSGPSITFKQFVPGVGSVLVTVQDSGSHTGFQWGENAVKLQGASWLGRHWDIAGGDFLVSSRLATNPFTNIYTPDIMARGITLQMSRGPLSYSIFVGGETLLQGPRLPFRIRAPQNVAGAAVNGKFDKLQFTVRLVQFDATSGTVPPQQLAIAGHMFRSVDTVTAQSSYEFTKHLKVYLEGAFAAKQQLMDGTPDAGSPFSGMAGPAWESEKVTVRANYVYQTASYLPIVGFFSGDRKGSFVEARYHPSARLDIYGSANQYSNNLEHSPSVPTFDSSGGSFGASANLPARISANAQISLLNLDSSIPASDTAPLQSSRNRQVTFTLTRPLQHHNLRLTILDLNAESSLLNQRQRSTEIEDTFMWKTFVLGGAVRLQSDRATETRQTLFYRGSVQLSVGRLSAYAHIEQGDDLASQSVFSTNSLRSTNVGLNARLMKGWSLQVEGFRNSLATTLNPERVFLLANQGVAIPTQLAGLNQWSVFFRLSKQLHWGAPLATSSFDRYTLQHNPLVGSVEGYVYQESLDGRTPVEGVPVALDEGRIATTDASGHYRFTEVPEGLRKVALATSELPAQFESGPQAGAEVHVEPRGIRRIDMTVRRLLTVAGAVNAPPDCPLDSVVIRLMPTDRYTTPEADGKFAFYNVPEGDYQVVVAGDTVPDGYIVQGPDRVAAILRLNSDVPSPRFDIVAHVVEKPVRDVLQKKIEVPQDKGTGQQDKGKGQPDKGKGQPDKTAAPHDKTKARQGQSNDGPGKGAPAGRSTGATPGAARDGRSR